MICKECKNIIVLNGFSKSNCIICGDSVITPHTPSYRICEECSNQLNACEQCGAERN